MSDLARSRAIVLRRTNYGEADRVVQFLTPGGKVSALARGVRKQKSKLAGGIELLATTDITTRSGRGDLAILTSARMERFFSHILNEYDRLQFAYYVLKDVGRVAEHVDDAQFFECAEIALESLDDTHIALPVIELWYRLQMAQLLGVGANLMRDADGRKLSVDATYRFDTTDMAFVTHPTGEYGSSHVKLLRLAATNPPRVINQVTGFETLLATCLVVARAVHE